MYVAFFRFRASFQNEEVVRPYQQQQQKKDELQGHSVLTFRVDATTLALLVARPLLYIVLRTVDRGGVLSCLLLLPVYFFTVSSIH